ncbi:bath-43 [Symbiodinium microadriaticum]|nr:bath-43 [Symbiodinium microadriaticum]
MFLLHRQATDISFRRVNYWLEREILVSMVQRLQRWCEAQLCNQLSAEQVCCILRQAHVFEAAQLEKACLSYIKDNSAQVLKLQAYSDLISKWPEVALKIHLFTAGVPEAEAAAIVQARKVRRLNDGVERTS